MSGPHPGYAFTGRMDDWARKYGSEFTVTWYDENAKENRATVRVPGPDEGKYQTY